jgi:hypothetical protein
MSKKASKKASLPLKLLRLVFRRKKDGKKRCFLLRLLGKLFGIFAVVYAILFTVFFFDLDGKLLFYVVEPLLCKHYDKMERKNPLDMPYEIK